jgi:hypothetical protein
MAVLEQNPPVRPYGAFGHQLIGSLVEYDPVGPFTGRQALGLPIGAQYLFGSFRSLDCTKYFAPVRHFHTDAALSLFVYSSNVGEDFTYERGSSKAHRGIIDMGQRDDGRWGWWRPEPEPRSFYLTDGATAHWYERGLIDITAEIREPMFQLAAPDSTTPLHYSSVALRVLEGSTIMGVEVGGYLFQEHGHLPFGRGWTGGAPFKELEGTWVAFVTEFADGNVHSGHLIVGRDNFSLAIIHRTDGPSYIASDIGVEYELDADGYAVRMRYEPAPGDVWEFSRVGGARLPKSPLPGGPCWVEGVLQQAGETRQWVHADAWMETYPDRLVDLVRAKPLA